MNDRDEVIVRVLQGRATLEERQEVRQWRRGHRDHDAYYRSVEAVWTLTGAVVPDRVPEIPFEALMQAARADLSRGPHLSPPPAETHGRRRGLRQRRATAALIAAGVAALAIGLGAVRLLLPTDGVLSEGAIATGPGEMTTITLSDASSIRLAPNSRLRLSESRNLRIAWLEGRAFFGIHANRDRPFVVYTEHGEARVIGTRFEVNTNDDEFTVLVVEGSVEVSSGGVGVDVTAGQMSRSQAGGQPVAARVNDVYQRMDWIGNAVVFQATPLREAIAEIEDRFSTNVEIADSTLENMLVTAAFSGESVSEILRVVCEVVNAVCIFDGPTVRMEGA